MPSFYPEGDAATPGSNELRTLHKINSLLGGGGSSVIGRQVYPSSPNPNTAGLVPDNPANGALCYDPAAIRPLMDWVPPAGPWI